MLPIINKYIVKGDDIWFSAVSSDKLYCLDMKKKTLKYLIDLPVNDEHTAISYVPAVLVGDEIYFGPGSESQIVKYNLDDNKIFTINSELLPGDFKYASGLCFGNKVFFIGVQFPSYTVLDIQKSKVSNYLLKDIENNGELLGNEGRTRGTTYINNNKAYITNTSNSLLLEIDLLSGKSKIVDVLPKIKGFRDIVVNGREAFLFSISGETIIKMSGLKTKYYREQSVINNNCLFALVGNSIFCVDVSSGAVVEVDIKKECCKRYTSSITVKLGDIIPPNYLNKICCIIPYDNKVFIETCDGRLWKLDSLLEEWKEEKIDYLNKWEAIGEDGVEEGEQDLFLIDLINNLIKR